MILWRLRGYSDPDGEYEGGVAECAIERAADGYRLLVVHCGNVQADERHAGIEAARAKAEMLRAELIALGWSDAQN